MDAFVLLSPLVVLAMLLLLGFAGCDLVFVIEPPPPILTLKVQFPSDLTVELAQFGFIPPGTTQLQTTEALAREDGEAGISTLSHAITSPALGGWVAGCRMQVSEGSDQASDFLEVSFTLDEQTPQGDAVFQALGRPANNNFRIVFNGLVPVE